MFKLPEWTCEFHGHRCPFMPIGYRMGILALERLGVNKSLNYELQNEFNIGFIPTVILSNKKEKEVKRFVRSENLFAEINSLLNTRRNK